MSSSDRASSAAFSGLFVHVERPEGCGRTTTSKRLPARATR